MIISHDRAHDDGDDDENDAHDAHDNDDDGDDDNDDDDDDADDNDADSSSSFKLLVSQQLFHCRLTSSCCATVSPCVDSH